MTAVALPALTDGDPVVIPATTSLLLPNGLRVIAVRHGTVPITEIRLRIPCSAPRAEAVLLGRVMTSSAAARGALRRFGGQLSVGADADHIGVECAVLSGGLTESFRQLNALLTTPSWSAQDTADERQRLSAQLDRARGALTGAARRTLLQHMFGTDRYAEEQPDPALVRRVTQDALAQLHAIALGPAGSTMVVVGPDPADAMLDSATRWLAGWSRVPLASARPTPLPSARPTAVDPRSARVVLTRADTAASAIRWGFPVVPRQHADHAPLQIANLVYGGYFGSRLTEGLRERDGLVYHPRSTIEHKVRQSILTVSVDVGGHSPSPVEQELRSVLVALAEHGPTATELKRARRYGVGSVKVGLQGQSTIASLVATLAVAGLGPDFLADLIRDLGRVSAADVSRVCGTYLRPEGAS